MIDNANQALMGKTLGRLGCGGLQHFDAAQRDWEKPRMLDIIIDDEKVLSLPIVGFDVHRQQEGLGGTKVTFAAVEP